MPADLSGRYVKATNKGDPSHKEREVARLYVVFDSLPLPLLNLITVPQLMIAYGIDLHGQVVETHKRQYLKQREGIMAGKTPRQGRLHGADRQSSSGQVGEVEDVNAQVVLERSARILTKTYAYAGDAGEKIAPEDALRLLVREFRQYDQSLLTRNEKRAVR